jgi:hypothetical protein
MGNEGSGRSDEAELEGCLRVVAHDGLAAAAEGYAVHLEFADIVLTFYCALIRRLIKAQPWPGASEIEVCFDGKRAYYFRQENRAK